MKQFHHRNIIFISIIIVAVILIISSLRVMISLNSSGSLNQNTHLNESSNATKKIEIPMAISAYSSESRIPQTTSPFLIKNQDNDIINLITKYYDAILNADKDAYDQITVDDDSIEIDILLRKMEYIVGYDNQEIYIAQGTGNIDLVAYIVYDLKINSIETTAPSIDQLLIKNVDGYPKLYFNELSLNEVKQLEVVRNHDEVKALIQTVNHDFEAAVQSDSHLSDFYLSLAERTTKNKK